ncbi:MAG: ATP-binding cassette domain-containing protein [Desulfobacterales bacterium]|nr:ATP-binding cassette domain-containing protein [Desulfobacterales bacterium]
MENQIKIKVRDLSFYYDNSPVLENIHLDIPRHTITSITGPSGQGKSSFLTALNRLWENIDGARVTGDVRINFGNGFEDIHDRHLHIPTLRQKVGMVFQIPNPLPMSIRKNIAFPLKLTGETDRGIIAQKTQAVLERACLWDEVKNRMSEDARRLSGGQQQRLCIARALVLDPQVLLLDEPTSSLDDTAAQGIEDLLLTLKDRCTIIMVSHYMDQVKRIADRKLILSDKQLKYD